MTSRTSVRHVLLDADGVLQRVQPGWADAAGPWLGERGSEVLRDFWGHERDALEGRADVLDVLGASLDRLGIAAPVEEVYSAIWLGIEVLPHTEDLLRRLRASGVGLHLGTNQTRRRAAHMRGVLGYDDLFDVSVYSCDLGASKPHAGFFERAVELIGAQPDEVLFVDDHEANVEGARAAGLRAGHWQHLQGLAELEAVLGVHGVVLPD